jgi:acetylornithine deacetylase
MSDTERAIAILRDLVAFPTLPRGSNLDLLDYVEDYLGGFGISTKRIYSDDQSRANLVATIGSDTAPGIILSGHTDVVPVEKTGWTASPWKLTERNGKLYGRGSTDMKGFLAVVLACVPDFQAANAKTPIHLCFSYDEEVGCLGVWSLVDSLTTLKHRPKLAIIGEPTMMKLVNAHKGKVLMRCTVHGVGGHSSYAPKHVNAIEYAARAITRINDMARSFETSGPFDHGYTVPFTTMQTATIHGGITSNITPALCSFDFEVRYLPNHSADDILDDIHNAVADLSAEMKAVSPEAGFYWDMQFAYPGMSSSAGFPGHDLIASLVTEHSDHVSYGTEGGVFQTYGGIPSVVCGPGDIAVAHKPDEYIAIDQITKGVDLMKRLAAVL